MCLVFLDNFKPSRPLSNPVHDSSREGFSAANGFLSSLIFYHDLQSGTETMTFNLILSLDLSVTYVLFLFAAARVVLYLHSAGEF